MTQASMYPPMIPLVPEWSLETIAVQAGRPARAEGASTNPPIVLSTTYMHDTARAYGRDGNDGWGAIEDALGVLEGGTALAFASGLAAVNSIADLVPAGGIVVLPSAAYYGVTNLFARAEANGRLTVRTVDAADTAAVIAATEGADMVWMESIANPTMLVSDVPAIIEGAHKHGALTVVDATFATPLRQKPLTWGADIVLHSATKTHRRPQRLPAGNRDLPLAGTRRLPGHPPPRPRGGARRHRAVPRPARTSHPAAALGQGGVERGRAGNPAEHPPARQSRQLPRAAGQPAAGTRGASAPRRLREHALVRAHRDAGTDRRDPPGLRLLAHATSLGGVETLIERRTRWEPEVAAGIPMTLCRVAVGIENVEDLWADLDGSIRRVHG